MTLTRRSAMERRRLLGLRRVIHFQMAVTSPATRPPVAVKAGITPKVAK